MNQELSDSSTLGDIGEKGFIRVILERLRPHPNFVNGFGHDASVISDGRSDAVTFFKIDRAPLPTAALRGWTNYQLWGRLAVTSNCSDILASGGRPGAVMIALILPPVFRVSDARDIVEGCAKACDAHNIVFAGGDTKEGETPQVVGSAIGFGQRSRILGRDGGRPGDLIVIAGRIGGFTGSYFQILSHLKMGGDVNDLMAQEWVSYMSSPRARWVEAEIVTTARGVSAGMDTSDGLYDALSTLTSSYGGIVELSRLPYHRIAEQAAQHLGLSRFGIGLGTGDWNIIYTMPPDVWQEVNRQAKADAELFVIGEIGGAEGLRFRDESGELFICRPVVNEHFVNRFENEAVLTSEFSRERFLRPA